MFLYTTILLIQSCPVRYYVSRQQGSTYLLFTPDESLGDEVDSPIFWVAKTDNTWAPINLPDPILADQVVEDIRLHHVV
jgi:hypothetical protein